MNQTHSHTNIVLSGWIDTFGHYTIGWWWWWWWWLFFVSWSIVCVYDQWSNCYCLVDFSHSTFPTVDFPNGNTIKSYITSFNVSFFKVKDFFIDFHRLYWCLFINSLINVYNIFSFLTLIIVNSFIWVFQFN